MTVRKPWGGRFTKPTDRLVETFTASIDYDWRLYPFDIAGSVAHARMLCRQGILTEDEADRIGKGLESIRQDIAAGRVTFMESDEDIHMAVERLLTERIGPVGGKLHTGRSRNDQVALDVRLYLRDRIDGLGAGLSALKAVVLALAKGELETPMPGYTHLQKAQPVLFSHYLLAYWQMFDRDAERLRDCRRRVDVSPLGAAALAGTSLPIDRRATAAELGFAAVAENSMDAVADRDFVVEFLADAAIVMMHLSRFCEDLVLYSSGEFRYLEMDDAFATGSSIMPQKKNPDVAEIIRGKTGRVYGNLVALLVLLKGLPMTYNRDLQEDKEPLFDTVETLAACLEIMAAMLKTLKVNRKHMQVAAGEGFSTATDMAEYLVRKGVPFREAHAVTGGIVAFCLRENRTLEALSLEEFRTFHRAFDQDIYGRLDVAASIRARTSEGGTAPERVREQIRRIEEREP